MRGLKPALIRYWPIRDVLIDWIDRFKIKIYIFCILRNFLLPDELLLLELYDCTVEPPDRL
jgi:hypothetical protein